MFQNFSKAIVVVAAMAFTGGCALVPSSGPASYDIDAKHTHELPYALVKLTPETVATLGHYEPRGLAGAFPDKQEKPANLVFGIGDVVSVTIFEAAAGGLFIPTEAGVRPGNFVTIPDQTVDNDGNISVPYAGLVKAGGRTNGEIQNDIVKPDQEPRDRTAGRRFALTTAHLARQRVRRSQHAGALSRRGVRRQGPHPPMRSRVPAASRARATRVG